MNYGHSSLLNHCVKCGNAYALQVVALGMYKHIINAIYLPTTHCTISTVWHFLKCSNMSLLYLSPTVVANIIVVTILVWIDRPLPTWMYPCLYYVQVCKSWYIYKPGEFIISCKHDFLNYTLESH